MDTNPEVKETGPSSAPSLTPVQEMSSLLYYSRLNPSEIRFETPTRMIVIYNEALNVHGGHSLSRLESAMYRKVSQVISSIPKAGSGAYLLSLSLPSYYSMGQRMVLKMRLSVTFPRRGIRGLIRRSRVAPSLQFGSSTLRLPWLHGNGSGMT